MKKEKLVALATVTLALLAILPSLAFARPQNDAGSGTDAGNTQQTALFIIPSSYTGALYGPNEEDMSDYYNFTAYNGHWINVTMTPPPNMDFHLQLLNSTGHLKAGSYKGVNETDSISYLADSDGTWTIHIFVNSTLDEGEYSFTIAPTNSPPEKPSTPSGASTGYVYTYYPYTTNTTDPNGDTLTYQFDWNDSSTTTIGTYPSGQPVTISHQWKYPQTYYIKVRAKDAHGLWSVWSDLKTVSFSQNDAGSGGDAGNTPSAALPISPGSYKGTLYYPNPIDTVDFYNFSIAVGDWMYVTMMPPSTADFQLEVHSPDGNVYGSYNGVGQMESINHRAEIGGIWSIRVSRYTGEGQYTLNLSITSGHVQLTVNVPQAPDDEGVTIWIDGQAYTAYANAPVIVTLATGTHTLQAQRSFLKEEWTPGTYFIYTFQKWSDGVTANPRNIDVTQNMTITAYYLRSKYGIQ